MRLTADNVNFYSLIVKGDLNGDGEIDISDTIAMKMHIVKIEGKELTGIFLDAADVDLNDIKANVLDLTKLVEYQIGLEDEL